jgi:hypothetical protein
MSFLDELLEINSNVAEEKRRRVEQKAREKAEEQRRNNPRFRTVDPSLLQRVDGDTFYDPELGRNVRIALGDTFESEKKYTDSNGEVQSYNPYTHTLKNGQLVEKDYENDPSYQADKRAFEEIYDKRDGFFRKGVTPDQLMDAGNAATVALDRRFREMAERGEKFTYEVTGLDEYGRALARSDDSFIQTLDDYGTSVGYNGRFGGQQRVTDILSGEMLEREEAKSSRGAIRAAGDFTALAGTTVLNIIEEAVQMVGQKQGKDLGRVEDVVNYIFSSDIDLTSKFKKERDEFFKKSSAGIEWFKDKTTSKAYKQSQEAAMRESMLNNDIYAYNVSQYLENGYNLTQAKLAAGTEEAANTIRNLAQSPGRVLDMTFESLPYMFGVAGIGRLTMSVAMRGVGQRVKDRMVKKGIDVTTKEGAELLSATQARFLASEAGKKYLQKVGSWSGVGAIGVTEGMSNAAAVYDRIFAMTPEEAMESQKYRDLIANDMTHEEALRELAEEAYENTFLFTTLLAGFASKVTGIAGWESRLFTTMADTRKVVQTATTQGVQRSAMQKARGYGVETAKWAGRRAIPGLGEAIEESVQSGGGQLVSDAVTQNVTGIDQNLGQGIGEATATGAATGAVSGTGISTAGSGLRAAGRGFLQAMAADQTGDVVTPTAEPVTFSNEQIVATPVNESTVPFDADDPVAAVQAALEPNNPADGPVILAIVNDLIEKGVEVPPEVIQHAEALDMVFRESASAAVVEANDNEQPAPREAAFNSGRAQGAVPNDAEGAALYNMGKEFEEAAVEAAIAQQEAVEAQTKLEGLEKPTPDIQEVHAEVWGLRGSKGLGMQGWANKIQEQVIANRPGMVRSAIGGMRNFIATQKAKAARYQEVLNAPEAQRAEVAEANGLKYENEASFQGMANIINKQISEMEAFASRVEESVPQNSLSQQESGATQTTASSIENGAESPRDSQSVPEVAGETVTQENTSPPVSETGEGPFTPSEGPQGNQSQPQAETVQPGGTEALTLEQQEAPAELNRPASEDPRTPEEIAESMRERFMPPKFRDEDGKPVPGDSRLKRSLFRDGLRELASQLVPNGGITYVRDENDQIVERTKSENPDWFKDKGWSIAIVNNAVEAALSNNPNKVLGARQQLIIETMLNELSEQRTFQGPGQPYNNMAELMAAQRAARAVSEQQNNQTETDFTDEGLGTPIEPVPEAPTDIPDELLEAPPIDEPPPNFEEFAEELTGPPIEDVPFTDDFVPEDNQAVEVDADGNLIFEADEAYSIDRPVTDEEIASLEATLDLITEEEGAPSATQAILERGSDIASQNPESANKMAGRSKATPIQEIIEVTRNKLREWKLPSQIAEAFKARFERTTSLFAASENFLPLLLNKRAREKMAEKLGMSNREKQGLHKLATFTDTFVASLDKLRLKWGETEGQSATNNDLWANKAGKFAAEKLREYGLQYFYNSEGELDGNVAAAMAAVGFQWLATRGADSMSNDEKAINDILSRDEDEEISNEEWAAFGRGTPRATVVQTLGKQVLRTLNLELTKDPNIDRAFAERMEVSIGNMILANMVQMEVAEQVEVSTEFMAGASLKSVYEYLEQSDPEGNVDEEYFKELYEDKQELLKQQFGIDAKTSTMNMVMAKSSETDPAIASEEVYNIKENYQEFQDTFEKIFNMPVKQRPPLFKEPTEDQISKRYNKKPNSIPKKLFDRLVKQSKRQYFAAQRTIDSLDRFEDDEIYENILGAPSKEDVDNAQVNRQASTKSKREQVVRSVDGLRKTATLAAGRAMYFIHSVTSSGRMNMDSNTINPQNNTIHRFLFRQKEWEVNVPIGATDAAGRERQKMFLLTVGLGFDIDFSKQSTEETLRLINEKYQKLVENGTIDGMNSADLTNTQKELIYEAVGSHGMHAYAALEALAAWHKAKADGQSEFLSDLPIEIDGKTNGFSAGLLQTPAGSELLKFLAATGVYAGQVDENGNPITNYPQWKQGENSLDNYESVGETSGNTLKDLSQGNRLSVEEDVDPPVENTEKKPFAKQEREVRHSLRDVNGINLVNDFGLLQKIQELTNTKGRKFAKGPLTVFSYMGGIDGIKESIANTAMDNLWERLEKVKTWEDFVTIQNQIADIVNNTINKAQLAADSPLYEKIASEPMMPKMTLAQAQKLNAQPTEYAQNYTLSPGRRDALKLAYKETYGYAAHVALNEKVEDLKEVRSAVTETYQAANNLFLAMWRTRIEGLKQKNTTGQVSDAERRQLLQQMIKERQVPFIRSPLSETQLDALTITDDGLEYLGGTDDSRFKGSAFFNQPTQTNTESIDTDGSIVESKPQAKSGNRLRGFEPGRSVGVRAIVQAVHSTDGTVMSKIVAEHPVLGVHDAVVGNFENILQIAQEANQEFFEIMRDYDLVQEAWTAAEIMLTALDKTQIGVQPEVQAAAVALQKVMFVGKENTASFEQLVIRNRRYRENLFSRITAVNQFAIEGGEYLTNGQPTPVSAESAETSRLIDEMLARGANKSRIIVGTWLAESHTVGDFVELFRGFVNSQEPGNVRDQGLAFLEDLRAVDGSVRALPSNNIQGNVLVENGILYYSTRPTKTFIPDMLEALNEMQETPAETVPDLNLEDDTDTTTHEQLTLGLGSSNSTMETNKWVNRLEESLTADNLKTVLKGIRSMEAGKLSDAGKAMLEELVNTFILPTLTEADRVKLKLGTNPDARANNGLEVNGTVYVEAAGAVNSSNVDMSLEEVTVHEVMHAITRHVLNDSPELQQRTQQLFNIALDALEQKFDGKGWKAFLTDPNSYNKAEEAAAKARWDYLFKNTNQQVGREGEQAPRYLHEFLALATTNPAFNEALSGVTWEATPDRIWTGDLVESIANLVSMVFHHARKMLTGVDINKEMNTEVAELLKDITKLRAQQQHRLKWLSDTIQNLGDKSDDFVLGIAENMTKALRKWGEGKESPKLDSDGRNRLQRTVQALKKAGIDGAQADIDSVRAVLADYFEDVNQNNWFFEILSEVLPYPEKNKSWIKMLRRSVVAIDMARQQANEHTRDTLLKAFDPKVKLVENQREAVTYAILKTDLGALFRNPTITYPALLELLKSGSSRRAMRTKLRNDLRAMLPQGRDGDVIYEYFLKRAEGLGHLMIHGIPKLPNQEQNALQIASQVSLDSRDRVDIGDVNDDLVAVLDQLASLDAISSQASKDPKMLDMGVRVLEHEMNRNTDTNGFTELVNLSIAHVDNSKEKLFDNNPMQMVKGYMYEVYDDNIDMEINFDDDATNIMMEAKGYKRVESLPQEPNDTSQPKAMYVSLAGLATYQKSVISLTNPRKRGQSLLDSYNVGMDEQGRKMSKVLARRALDETKKRHARNARAVKNGQPMDGDIFMLPIFDDKGNVADYRYVMSEDTKKGILKKRDTFDEVFPRMVAAIGDRRATRDINSQVVEMLKDEWVRFGKPDDNGVPPTKTVFISISPNSQDERAREMWALLPDETKRAAEQEFGRKELRVRSDAVNLIFGFRKLAISNNEFLGRSAPAVKVAETVWQEAVSFLRYSVAITTPAVVVGNIVSNMAVLLTEGIPPSYIYKHSFTAVKSLRKYQREVKESDHLKRRIESERVRGRDTSKMEAQLARLQANLRANPVDQLVQEGLFTSIVEDLGYDQQRTSTKLLNKAMNKVSNTTGLNAVTTVGKELFMVPGSQTGNAALVATQMGDFTARYVKMKYDIEEKGVSRDDAINDALQKFIYYNMPQNKYLQWMNDNGFMMFTKFFLRIQPVAIKLFADNPARAMTVLAAQRGVLSNIDSVWGENTANYAFMNGATRKFEPTPWQHFTGDGKSDSILRPALLDWLSVFGIGD